MENLSVDELQTLIDEKEKLQALLKEKEGHIPTFNIEIDVKEFAFKLSNNGEERLFKLQASKQTGVKVILLLRKYKGDMKTLTDIKGMQSFLNGFTNDQKIAFTIDLVSILAGDEELVELIFATESEDTQLAIIDYIFKNAVGL